MGGCIRGIHQLRQLYKIYDAGRDEIVIAAAITFDERPLHERLAKVPNAKRGLPATPRSENATIIETETVAIGPIYGEADPGTQDQDPTPTETGEERQQLDSIPTETGEGEQQEGTTPTGPGIEALETEEEQDTGDQGEEETGFLPIVEPPGAPRETKKARKEREDPENAERRQREDEAGLRRSTRSNKGMLKSKAMLAREIKEPLTYQEAMKDGPDKDRWLEAMQKELRSIQDRKTWEMLPLPEYVSNVIDSKWVFKVKCNEEGEPTKFKARLVARGFSQIYGVDYEETFAPTVHYSSLRVLFAIVAREGWFLHQMDVVSAYLAGELTEEIWMSPPEGVTARKGECCRLRKSLYGLKQAARVWFQLLTGYLEGKGFWALPAEPSMLSNGRVIVAIYVDDMLIAGASIIDVEEAKELLRRRFEVTDLGEAKTCIGIHIQRDMDRKLIYIDQSAYARKIVGQYLPAEAYPASIPMGPKDVAAFNQDQGNGDRADVEWYRGAVGSLMYLVNTRPDLAFSIHRVAQFSQNPRHCHRKAVEQILCYVKGTISHGIRYQAETGESGERGDTEVYSDSDFAGDPVDRRSTIGCVVRLHGGAVHWYSRKIRSIVPTSTSEAEYIGLSEAGKEAIWIRRLLANVLQEEEDKGGPMRLIGDNDSSLRIAEGGPGPRTKHLSVKYHFIRNIVRQEMVQLEWCPARDQLADTFTKALPQAGFLQKQEEIGVCPVGPRGTEEVKIGMMKRKERKLRKGDVED